MDRFLIQAIPITGIGGQEDTFWIQIFVLLLLAVFWGVYTLVKNKRKELKDRQDNLVEEMITHRAQHRRRLQLLREPRLAFDSSDTVWREKTKDLHSGMELLESDYLLSVVDNTEENDLRDLTIRKLNFNELLRRNKLNQVSSRALKVYAMNQGSLYGKDIQCEAMRQLAERTAHKSKQSPLQPALTLSR